MPVMNEVGEQFVNFIRTQPKNKEFNAKDVSLFIFRSFEL